MKLAPWLPWQDDPADPPHQTKLLNYAPFAAIMWSFFIEIGSSYDSSSSLHLFRQNKEPVYNHVLHPGQCSEVLKVFETSGFTHDGSSFVSLSMAIQAYATDRRFPGSYLSASRHLQKVKTWDFETSFPPGHFEYGSTHPPDVCMLADEFSSSYGPMGLF